MNANATINYYERVLKTMGGAQQVTPFARLFMLPGLGHCNSTDPEKKAPNIADFLTALEQWVEKGAAPDKLIASHTSNGKVDRTRPLCPYPQVARYTGTGSIDEAENFTCQLP